MCKNVHILLGMYALKICIRLIPIFLVMASVPTPAETIEFPEEELATESVLPVFDNARGVLNRAVVTKGRFEVGGGAGLALNEPFYNPMNFYIEGSYHFTELHGLNIKTMFLMDGLSDYGEQLKTSTNLGQPFDASEAPQPKNILLASYQLTAFYGKISLTKKSVMNLSLFGLAGAGLIGLDSGTQLPALNIGFGQKFYFSPKLALRLDFRLIGYSGPDPTSQTLDPTDTVIPSEGSFKDEIFFNTYITGGVVFLM